MLTWMQKHKKWLVVTIWISTIAFVGAGFVGWGSYNYGKQSGDVATVGNKKIEIQDLQTEYSNLYSQYQQMFGAKFNQELADKLNLKNIAYENLVQKYLLLNLASEFGISATNKEIAEELVKIPSFIKNGKFDKTIYINILKQNRTNPTEFEAQIKRDITIQKVTKIFGATLNNNSLKNINRLFFAQDKVSINIINHNNFKIKPTQKELKDYYDKNKNNYKTSKEYLLNIAKIKLSKDKKIDKRTALKKYLSLRKGSSKFNNTMIVNNSTIIFNKDNLKEIISSKIGKILKPIKTKENYIIVQLSKIIQPKIQPYNKVKKEIKQAYINFKIKELVAQKRNLLLKTFKGKDIGYISKDDTNKILNLTLEQTNNLRNSIFTSNSVINFIELANKTIVYKILDTKLASYDKSKDKFLEKNILKLKNQEILESLISKLRTKYTVISNMKVK